MLSVTFVILAVDSSLAVSPARRRKFSGTAATLRTP